MTKLAIYDPPMCCSSGVCGPAVDPVLPRIAADLDWLRRQGIEVERFNLAQQPQAFASNPFVTAALREHGNDCLPLILVDDPVASCGTYPDRGELARLTGLASVDEPGAVNAQGSTCCSSPSLLGIGDAQGRSSGDVANATQPRNGAT